jgi:hypothetical protein
MHSATDVKTILAYARGWFGVVELRMGRTVSSRAEDVAQFAPVCNVRWSSPAAWHGFILLDRFGGVCALHPGLFGLVNAFPLRRCK